VAYDVALRHHYETNDHHPEFFHKGGVVSRMNDEAMMELLADWFAASKAYHGTWPIPGQWPWVQRNYPTLPMHQTDKLILGALLSIFGYAPDIPSFDFETSRNFLEKTETPETVRRFNALYEFHKKNNKKKI